TLVGVEDQAAGADGRHPVVQRLLHARRLAQAFADRGAVVVHAMADHRPAVVAAGTGDVQLVAALGTVFGLPELTGIRMQGRALHVAVAVRPDRRQRLLAAGEGVVGRNAAVAFDPVNLALALVQALHALGLAAVAGGDVEPALAVEDQARAEVMAGAQLGLLAEDHLHALQPLVLDQARPRHRRAGATVARFGIAQVD